jgi:restriction endonuclease S subunit
MWKIGAEDIRSFPLLLPPFETQRDIVRQVQAVRIEVARLRAKATKLRRDTKEEVERLILGTKSVFGLV